MSNKSPAEDTTPIRLFVPGLTCFDGTPTGKFMLREARPLSREQVRAGLSVEAWETLPEALRDASTSVLLCVIDEAGDSWILLAGADVLEAAVAMVDGVAFPGAFYLVCREARWASIGES